MLPKAAPKQKAAQAKATQPVRMGSRQSKRLRSAETDTESEAIAGPSGLCGKKHKPSQGEKRKGATSPLEPHKKPKTKWQDLLTDDSEDEPMESRGDASTSSQHDGNANDEVKTVTVANLAVQGRETELTVSTPPGVKPPERATEGAAGWDCRSTQTLTMEPGRTVKVPLGFSMFLPKGWSGLLLSRSKLACEGVTVEAGLIDSDHRGPVLCVLHNGSGAVRRIQCGERICQLVFVPVPTINWITEDKPDETSHDQSAGGA